MNLNFSNFSNNKSSNAFQPQLMAFGMGGAALWTASNFIDSNKPNIFNFKNLSFGFNSASYNKIFDSSSLLEKAKGFSFQGDKMSNLSKMFFKSGNNSGYQPGHVGGGGELGGAGKKMSSRHQKKIVAEEVEAVVKQIGEEDIKNLYTTLSEKLDWYIDSVKKFPVSQKEYLEDPILELKQSCDVKVVDEFQHIAKKEFVQGREGGLAQLLHNGKLQSEINTYLIKYFPNYENHVKHINHATKLPNKFKTLYNIMTYVVHLNSKIKK